MRAITADKIAGSPAAAWWDYVSGPALFLRETAAALSDGKNVRLQLPFPLPWRSTFYEHLAEEVREDSEYPLLEEVGAEVENPGIFLIERFGLEAEYRRSSSPEDFLRTRRAFADRILCVSAPTSVSAERWHNFGRKYKPASSRDGLLIMEAGSAPPSMPKHFRLLRYQDYVSEYDVFIFAGLLMPSMRMSADGKRYLSALTASLFALEPERSVDFVASFSFDKETEELCSASNKTTEQALHCIWSAQVQTLFPLIMTECRAFIRTWRREIEGAYYYARDNLPYGLTTTYGDQVDSPDDLELATLRYMMRNRRRGPDGEPNDEYILYVPDADARERIDLLHSMRNRIAHGVPCNGEEVAALLTNMMGD